mmetsp:Transcript_16707/g.59256  ORF Transcript_16707/g.59256 Transcript_16707/m.59256 type:complete len:182 (-) Transcript_16707:168-713(-)
MAMLQERDDRLLCSAYSTHVPCHFFSSFFISKLMGTDGETSSYDAVRRWTKNINLFAMRLVLAPVCIGNKHWCLIAVDMEQKTVRYYDSCGGAGTEYIRPMLDYLAEEHRTAHGSVFEPNLWTMVPTTQDTPQQSNGYDCGVFASYCALYLANDVDPAFSQEDVPLLRRRMMMDILYQRII